MRAYTVYAQEGNAGCDGGASTRLLGAVLLLFAAA